ncbi:hypothetical protein [Marimonas arenosa]|uniref:Uncharacterized protein n=1 Tax=Marimonas arenosa TaxID=1795305 RepID=A0AAE4B3A4_9RHOB|nr:hypothetical protein [Marimonas arenosa]MDQ2089060.1 hypothetical protein [Marimonas arenosa]
MDWFERLTGFAEDRPRGVRERLRQDDEWIESRVNGRRIRAGRFSHPTLEELRAAAMPGRAGRLRLSEVVADVRELHRDPRHEGAAFQVASQFNLLEMISPEVTPDEGIGRYESDRTQGPACALSCGAGTIFRNYLVAVGGGRRGQTARHQLDGLDALGAALGNDGGRLWKMQNGYALATAAGLATVTRAIAEGGADGLRRLIRVGVQAETEVTLDGAGHCVTQVYCSAMPVAYSEFGPGPWEGFARLALDAAYEATFLVARETRGPLFLTLLGGGAFGNPVAWILAALERALTLFAECDLDVRIVSHGAADPALETLLARFG